MLSNAELKRLSELKDRAGRREQGLFFIEGKRAVMEAITGNASIRRLILSSDENRQRLSQVEDLARENGLEIEELPGTKFNKLASTETSQGVIAVARTGEVSPDELLAKIRPKRSVKLILLDRVSDPGNLGTILRSAAWFAVDGVLIAAGSVDAYNPKVVRSAMAAICQLDVVQDVEIAGEIAQLKSIGFTVVASTQDAAVSHTDYAYPKRVAVIFGAEATGIAPHLLGLCDMKVAIPRAGKMESLNVGAAASIVLAEMMRQGRGKR